MPLKRLSQPFSVLFSISFAVTLGFSILHPFMSIYVRDAGGGGVMIALVFCGYSLTKMIGMPVFGRWSDRISRKPFILAGLVLHVLSSILFIFLPVNLLLIGCLRVMQGAGSALIRTAVLAAVGECAAPKSEGTTMGTFDVAFYSAVALGPLLGGFLHDAFGYFGLFAVLLGLSLSSLLLAAASAPEAHAERRYKEIDCENRRRFARTDTLWGLYCYIFTRAAGIVSLAVFWPVHLKDSLHFSPMQIGITLSLAGLLTPLLLRPAGKLSDRFDRRRLVAVGGTGSALMIMAIPLAVEFSGILMIAVTMGLFSTLSLPAASALLIEEGRGRGMGFAIGSFNAFMNAGFLLAPIFGGLLFDASGPKTVFVAAGLIGIIGAAGFAVLSRPENQKKFHLPANFTEADDRKSLQAAS